MNDLQIFHQLSRKPEEILNVFRQRIEAIEIPNHSTAQLICQLIPASCPFERKLRFFGRTLFQIPPLCQLNPLYNSLMILRFRALTFINEVCQ
ncbi:MAG: Mo-dependent nitrogenase [Moorea sp. SIO4A3]|nr:Mo-dependent nitrogenase [Moorena sp. SIO4A3]